MALQIANPAVVAKIEKLAQVTGLNKTAAVEKAVDALLRELQPGETNDVAARLDAILAQMDQIPEVAEPFDPLEWDEGGLPR